MDNKIFLEHVHAIFDSSLEITTIDFPDFNLDGNVEMIDFTDLRTASMILLERSRTEWLLIVTDSDEVKTMIENFNIIFNGNGKYISLLYRNNLYADKAKLLLKDEMRTLHSSGGETFLPMEQELIPSIYKDKRNDSILCHCDVSCTVDIPEERLIFDTNNELWGYVLEEKLSARTLNGTITEVCAGDDPETRLKMAKSIVRYISETNTLPIFDETLVFDTYAGTEFFTVCRADDNASVKAVIHTLFRIFFQCEPLQKDKLELLFTEKSKHSEYPASLFSFFEYLFRDSILPSLYKNRKITIEDVMTVLATVNLYDKECCDYEV